MRIFAILAAVLAFALPVQAQQKDIEAVIASQLQYFQKDDFAGAFTHAAPNIKQIFRTPERFGQMVTNGYPMVHRPAEIQFKELETNAGVQVQNVLIRDLKGTYYLAQYTMVMVDGEWQIAGVNIVPAQGGGV